MLKWEGQPRWLAGMGQRLESDAEAASEQAEMPRYVIQEHHHQGVHWDLMLESGGRLLTWRLEHPLSPDRPIRAESLPDHRLAYLEYEGPVSGGRGTVRRWDWGQFDWLERSGESVAVRLAGRRLRGTVHLSLTAGGSWTAAFRPAESGSGGSSSG